MWTTGLRFSKMKKMKKFIPLILLFSMIYNVYSQDVLKGVWNTGEDNTLIEVYKKDEAYFGKIVSSDNSKATIGLDVMRNFILTENKWIGKIYSLKKKKEFDAELIDNGDLLKIAVSAGFFTKKLEWKIVSN